MRNWPSIPSAWQARLIALPGVLTFLWLLGLVWGSPPTTQDVQLRVVTGNTTANVPLARPMPDPTPKQPLLIAPPPKIVGWARALADCLSHQLTWPSNQWRLTLALLNRWQIEGG